MCTQGIVKYYSLMPQTDASLGSWWLPKSWVLAEILGFDGRTGDGNSAVPAVTNFTRTQSDRHKGQVLISSIEIVLVILSVLLILLLICHRQIGILS